MVINYEEFGCICVCQLYIFLITLIKFIHYYKINMSITKKNTKAFTEQNKV